MRALVTGATSGIGEAVAHLLKRQGYELVVTGRSEARLPDGEKIVCDLNDPTPVIDAIRANPPNLVINCAGLGLYGAAHALDTKEQLGVVQINVFALMEITIEAVKAMKSAGKEGTIVNISSAAAFFPFPHFAAYAASKAFVNSFSMSLDDEVREEGIRVLTMCPGMVKTDFQRRAAKGKEIDSKGMMSPEEVARAIYRQIRKKKSMVIFDWRYWLGVQIARLLPHSLVRKVLRGNLSSRHDNI